MVIVYIKTPAVNTARKVLIMLNNPLQMHLKLPQKDQFKNTAETTGDLIGNKIADRITSLKNVTTK